MPWDRSSDTNPKYRSRKHIAYTKHLKQRLKDEGHLTCTAKVCVMPSRTITNPDGREPDGLTAGHADNGVDYDGPQHRQCNAKDGAKRARARQDTTQLTW
jgi:hypothetical protein